MNPATAAKKLELLLAATPEEFRAKPLTRSEVQALMTDTPEWVKVLRADGPHPREVVARKLGVSNSGLARGGIVDPLTTPEIKALLDEMPDWLVAERERQAAVVRENARIKREKRPAGEPRDAGGRKGGSGV